MITYVRFFQDLYRKLSESFLTELLKNDEVFLDHTVLPLPSVFFVYQPLPNNYSMLAVGSTFLQFLLTFSF